MRLEREDDPKVEREIDVAWRKLGVSSRSGGVDDRDRVKR